MVDQKRIVTGLPFIADNISTKSFLCSSPSFSSAPARSESIFCHNAGLDYVSASPHRIPIAIIAAAQAALLDTKRASECEI